MNTVGIYNKALVAQCHIPLKKNSIPWYFIFSLNKKELLNLLIHNSKASLTFEKISLHKGINSHGVPYRFHLVSSNLC
jgi:hypothetical protein